MNISRQIGKYDVEEQKSCGKLGEEKTLTDTVLKHHGRAADKRAMSPVETEPTQTHASRKTDLHTTVLN